MSDPGSSEILSQLDNSKQISKVDSAIWQDFLEQHLPYKIYYESIDVDAYKTDLLIPNHLPLPLFFVWKKTDSFPMTEEQKQLINHRFLDALEIFSRATEKNWEPESILLIDLLSESTSESDVKSYARFLGGYGFALSDILIEDAISHPDQVRAALLHEITHFYFTFQEDQQSRDETTCLAVELVWSKGNPRPTLSSLEETQNQDDKYKRSWTEAKHILSTIINQYQPITDNLSDLNEFLAKTPTENLYQITNELIDLVKED